MQIRNKEDNFCNAFFIVTKLPADLELIQCLCSFITCLPVNNCKVSPRNAQISQLSCWVFFCLHYAKKTGFLELLSGAVVPGEKFTTVVCKFSFQHLKVFSIFLTCCSSNIFCIRFI